MPGSHGKSDFFVADFSDPVPDVIHGGKTDVGNAVGADDHALQFIFFQGVGIKFALFPDPVQGHEGLIAVVVTVQAAEIFFAGSEFPDFVQIGGKIGQIFRFPGPVSDAVAKVQIGLAVFCKIIS